MIRWIRTIAIAALVLFLIGVGIFIGLFLVANAAWVPIQIPPWLEGLLGKHDVDAWLPALLSGWLLAIISVVALLGWTFLYSWRRRQSESLIKKLERELAALRNLPFKSPAPLEDLDETPDAELGRRLDETDANRADDEDRT